MGGKIDTRNFFLRKIKPSKKVADANCTAYFYSKLSHTGGFAAHQNQVMENKFETWAANVKVEQKATNYKLGVQIQQSYYRTPAGVLLCELVRIPSNPFRKTECVYIVGPYSTIYGDAITIAGGNPTDNYTDDDSGAISAEFDSLDSAYNFAAAYPPTTEI